MNGLLHNNGAAKYMIYVQSMSLGFGFFVAGLHCIARHRRAMI
jgi:hypothetical protein